MPLALAAQRQAKPAALTTADGLGFRDIRAIAQDPQGLMWIGTAQGLERYDGLHFFRYGSDAQTDMPFPGSSVSDKNMLLVNDSSLWVVADEVLYAMNLRTQKTVNLSESAGLTGKVYNLRQAKDGAVWIVIDDGRQKERLLFPLSDSPELGLIFGNVFHFVFDEKENTAWALNNNLLKIDLAGRQISVYDTFDAESGKSRNPFCQLKDGTFILGNSLENLTLYDPASRKRSRLLSQQGNDILSTSVEVILEDSKGRIWIGTAAEGLFCFNRKGDTLAHFSTKTKPALSNDHERFEHQNIYPERRPLRQQRGEHRGRRGREYLGRHLHWPVHAG